jgi:hypothetical protein
MRQIPTESDSSRISRRKYLLSALGAGGFAGGGFYLRNTFRDAQDRSSDDRLIRQRQEVLETLAREMPCPDFASISYDHHKTLIMANVHGGTADAVRLADELDSNSAMTVMPIASFGLGRKSPVYFFPTIFEPGRFSYQGKPITVSFDAKLRVGYVHESFHAKYNAEGLDLGTGMRIDASNVGKYNTLLVLLLLENAYIDTYIRVRDSNEHDETKIWAAGNFGTYSLKLANALETLDLGQLEEIELFNHQVKRANVITLDAKALLSRLVK